MSIFIQFLLILLSGTLFAKCNDDAQQSEDRIVGGTDGNMIELHYQASIQVKYYDFSYHICGGTIISNQHVVSAAHCFHRYKVSMHIRVLKK